MLNINDIKKDFSVFKNMPELVYLDSAATSLKPDSVIDAMNEYYKEYPFSINRGSYKMSVRPTQKVEESRQLVAEFFNVNINEVVFVRSTTSGINLVANSIRNKINMGDEIIVTNLEHHSNFLPWQILCKEKDAKLQIVKSRDSKIYIEDVVNLVNENTKVIAIHHVSNLLGDEVDIKVLVQKVKEINKDIVILVDGAQSAPHIVVDLKEIGCDFYVCSGHKLLGPTGIGILYVSENVADDICPLEYGGDMVEPSSVDVDTCEFKAPYKKFEAGTPSIAEIIGIGSAIKYLNKIGMENIHEHEMELKKYAIELFDKISDKVEVYNKKTTGGLIVFNIKGVAVHDAVSASIVNDITFDEAHIAIRDGQHCNNLTMKYVFEEKSVLRASFYLYNSREDVEKLVKRAEEIYDAWH